MKSKIAYLILFSFLLLSCNTTINVIPVKNNNTQLKKSGIIYFLPRVFFEIETEVVTEYFIPGPYARYAEKFLSIKDVPSQRTTSSKINSVTLKEYFEADPNASFLILNNKKDRLYFGENAVLYGFNTSGPKDKKFDYPHHKVIQNANSINIHFPNMSVEDNFTSILDTTYRVIQIDSIFQKIPVYNSVMTSKSEEQKAEEIAEFIIELRKSRFSLLQGDVDLMPESGAMEQMLIKLDELEQTYIELFIGKSYLISNMHIYRFTPEHTHRNENFIMFYLCDNLGITEKEGAETSKVILNYNSLRTATEFDKFFVMQSEIKEKNKGIYYRIPSNAIVNIMLDDELLTTKKLIVPQAGIINSVPEYIMKSKKRKIKLHPEYGSILFIN